MDDLSFLLALILCWALLSPSTFGEWLGRIAKAYKKSTAQNSEEK